MARGGWHQGTGVWSWEGFWPAQGLKKTYEVLAPNPITLDARSQLCPCTFLPPRTQASTLSSAAFAGPFSPQPLVPPDTPIHHLPLSCTVSDPYRTSECAKGLSHFWTLLMCSFLPQMPFPLFRAWVLQHVFQDPNKSRMTSSRKTFPGSQQAWTPCRGMIIRVVNTASTTVETNRTVPVLGVGILWLFLYPSHLANTWPIEGASSLTND